jgi:formate-dependent nitrite reductase membrane component NrfD
LTRGHDLPLHRTGQGLGLLAPLALLLPSAVTGRPARRPVLALAAVASLAGGYLIRYSVVSAGKVSADRPQDYFAWTRSDE